MTNSDRAYMAWIAMLLLTAIKTERIWVQLIIFFGFLLTMLFYITKDEVKRQ